MFEKEQKNLEKSIGEIEKWDFNGSLNFRIKSKDGKVFECCADQLVADDTYEYIIAYNADYAMNGIVFKDIMGLNERLCKDDMYDSYSGEPIISTEEKKLVVMIGKYMINEAASVTNK